jgi:adhesin transport system outer membrane protein
MAKDLDAYYSFYSPNFGPIKANRAKWMAERKRLVTKPGDIKVVLDGIQAQQISPTRVETTFVQTYNSSNFNDTMTKTLTWELERGSWLIVKETNR